MKIDGWISDIYNDDYNFPNVRLTAAVYCISWFLCEFTKQFLFPGQALKSIAVLLWRHLKMVDLFQGEAAESKPQGRAAASFSVKADAAVERFSPLASIHTTWVSVRGSHASFPHTNIRRQDEVTSYAWWACDRGTCVHAHTSSNCARAYCSRRTDRKCRKRRLSPSLRRGYHMAKSLPLIIYWSSDRHRTNNHRHKTVFPNASLMQQKVEMTTIWHTPSLTALLVSFFSRCSSRKGLSSISVLFKSA